MAPRGRTPVEPEVLLSASGLSRLGECETRWLWHPSEDGPPAAKSRALDLGTYVHALVEARLRKQDWRAALDGLAAEVPGWEPGYHLPDPLPTAEWLMDRHEQVYPTLPQAVATESQFELWLPDAAVPTKIRGRSDGLVMLTQQDINAIADGMRPWSWHTQVNAAEFCEPGLYLWETKTMGRWDRLDWLGIDPQLGTYFWAADQCGFAGVKGVVYESILTTQWKTAPDAPKGHPVTDSFRRLVIPRNEALVQETLRQYHAAAARAAEIQADPSRAVKAAGRNCGYCPAFKDCHPYAQS